MDGEAGLHADSFDMVFGIAGKPVARRHPDEDHVQVLGASQAQ
ncbi:hypothetical protein OG205_04190 [Lentzea sp. NBC_00516]|nr:hypothetical protein [Lentzea sp. NBC_00516]WUD26218.1 hypothetical protein OG205_04190 [Lentzea sp. NBC_00516]